MKINKKIIAVFAFLIIFFSVLAFSQFYMNMKYLSEKEVKEIALFQSNSNIKDISDYICEKEINESGIVTFKISYSDSKGVYYFILDGKDGRIIEYSKLKHGEPLPEIFESSKQVSK